MAELYKLIVSVESLVIAMIVFKRYPSTNCLMQGSCFICINLLKFGILKFEIYTSKLELQPLNV